MEPRLRQQSDIAVRRGRDASTRIKDMIEDLKAKGHEVLNVSISRTVADAMKAYFESITRFDGILPKHCHGVPLFIDLSASSDYVILSRPKGRAQ